MNEEGSVYSIHTICRICLNLLNNDVAYDLFAVPGLAKRLCVCTSLSVEPHDGFPNNLCNHCNTRLNDMHEFQQMCVDSVQKFQDLVANNFFVPVVNQIDNVEVFSQPEEEIVEDRVNFDPLLNTKVEVIENEEDVFKLIENVDKETLGVDKTNDSTEESDDLDNQNDDDFHVSESEDSLPLSRLKVGTRSSKTRTMKVVVRNANDDSEGSSSESESDEECEKKPKQTKRKRIPAAERDRHKLIECHICHSKFKRALRYEEHMKHHNDLLPYQCTVETCKKGFTTPSGVRLHMDHSHPELCPIIPCTFPGCDKTFPKTVLLTFHMKKVHNVAKPVIKRHACTECDKVFTCPTALKKHMYKHTGEELPFACEVCGKRFPVYTALRDHLLRHAGIKNHVCPYCGVGKTTRQEWNKHILTHTREKQYKCPQCDHATHNKQALTNHINVVHKKIRKHACQYCGKTFGKSFACKTHERLHTGENCASCNICGRKFMRRKCLTKHLLTHEKGEIPKAKKTKTEADEGNQNTSERGLEECAPAEQADIKPPEPKPNNCYRVEVVDISQLAGLNEVNPISSVSVPSWSQAASNDFPVTKDDQYICPECGRGFNHMGNMKKHYKAVHENVKDFICRYCPKRFARAQHLRNHELIHTGEKPFECKVCGKNFRQKVVLWTHMKLHTQPPKEKKPKRQAKNPRGPKVKLPQEPPKIPSEYQDPEAERAAATAALQAQQIEEGEEKLRKQENNRKIQEAASEQLSRLQKEIQSEKGSYDSYYEQKADAEGLNPNVLKLDHV